MLRGRKEWAGAVEDLADHFVHRSAAKVIPGRPAFGPIEPGHVAPAQAGNEEAQAEVPFLQLA
jgi:hypothetical protein